METSDPVARLRASCGLAMTLLIGCTGAEPARLLPAAAEPAATPTPAAPTPLAAPTGAALAEAIALALARDCPPVELADPRERERCADALTRDPTLRAGMSQPYMRWGAQSPGAGYEIDASNTTLFDPRVWRRLYLSTFAFPGGHRIEQAGTRFIAHVPVVFRNTLDPGEYPYPFWHSQPKWQSYERTEALLLFIDGDSLTAVLRSAEQDEARPHVAREWDGRWRWSSERGEEPRAALYGFMFSPDNPHVQPLQSAFRAFSEKQRAAACESCHNPGNPSKINPLEFFNYPNQALTSRHDVVAQLVKNRMPPPRDGGSAGLDDESYRSELLALARDFASLGDRALAFESTRAAPESAAGSDPVTARQLP